MTTRQSADQAMLAYLRATERHMDHFGSALPGNQDRAPHRLAIVAVDEYDFGWVYFYNSQEYIETGDFLSALGGNAPVIVSRESCELFETGTAFPTEYYIQQFIVGLRTPVSREYL